MSGYQSHPQGPQQHQQQHMNGAGAGAGTGGVAPGQFQQQQFQQQNRPLPPNPPHTLEPERGIPQPPHSAGQRIPGKLRVRIDPDHIPSPVTVQDVDQQLWRDEPYMTCSRMAAPLATTEFVAIDQGQSLDRLSNQAV